MAQKTQMVTIPLEEYKELLLKDKPQSSNDSVILERFINEIIKKIEYTESTYYSSYIGDNMKIDEGDKVISEFMKMLKYVDFDCYMSIWNSVMTTHQKVEDAKARIDQMNKAKEIRQEGKESNT